MQTQVIVERKGFTLIEVIVSAVIVALTAAGIFASFIAAQNYVSRSRGRTGTSSSVRQQIETLKVEVNQTIWSATATCNPDTNGLALTAACTDGWTNWGNVSGTFGLAPYFGKRRYKVTELNPGSGGARKTEVQVNWTEPGT
jgi:prepilin-type N-terminal cleavage/methylation domain-containing protein